MDKKQNNDFNELPIMAMKDIPTTQNDAQSIVELVKENGRVTGYKLSNGQVLNKEQGVQLAKEGKIKGVGIAERNGNEYLKSIPDSEEGNNLSNLPSQSAHDI